MYAMVVTTPRNGDAGVANSKCGRTPGETASPQVITMTAKKYEFTPSTITVVRGHAVRIEATALDKTHGIEIKSFNVKVKLEKGKTTVIEFMPDRAGSSRFGVRSSAGSGTGT